MKKFIHGVPTECGFAMPAEFSAQEGCIMIWPSRPGSWIYGARDARIAFSRVILAIAADEKVFVACQKEHLPSALTALFDGQYEEKEGKYFYKSATHVWNERDNICLFEAETDDAWARDVAPTFVRNDSTGEVCGVNWQFNAWGGEYDGLYAHWEKDDAFAPLFCERFSYPCFDARPFVLEGGSVHSDGEGTLLVTESCLLSPGRNPALSKAEIEEKLKVNLGAKKVLWLPRGIYNDETNEHVDNVCAFIRPSEVVLAWTDDKNDPQYPLSKACLDYLNGETDAVGRKITVHKLPIPDHPVTITQEELDGYDFEEGEDEREAGERLAASYVNFYFSNNSVIFPTFGGENEESDRRAEEILTALLPERKIVPIPARAILVGGGNIHCITQQIPKGEKA